MRASCRSGETSTPVTVTIPIRGSASSTIASATTARTHSFTRRIRSVIGRHQDVARPGQHPVLAREPGLGPSRELLGLPCLPGCEGRRQRAALPEVVVVDLGDGGTEPVRELRLRREHVLALALQRPGLGEVQLRRENRDVAGQGVEPAGLADLGRLVERRPLDLARLVDLEDVTLAQAVEPVEQDAALEALAALADVVLEALQLRDRRLVD